MHNEGLGKTSQVLCELFRIQRAFYEDNCQLNLTDAEWSFLNGSQFLQSEDKVSKSVKLPWLSTCLTFLSSCLDQNKHGIDTGQASCLFNMVKDYLTPKEDRFIVYEASQVVYKLIHLTNIKAGITFIQEVLETETNSDRWQIVLDICSDLLSSETPNVEVYLSTLGPSLLHVTQLCLKANVETNCEVTKSQCLGTLLRIFNKITKHQLHNDEAVSFIQELLKSHIHNLADLLFIEDYSDRSSISVKSLSFFNTIIKGCAEVRDLEICKSLYEIGSKLMLRFEEVDWKRVFYTSTVTSFVGREKGDNEDILDTTRVQEWSFLYIGVIAVMSKVGNIEERGNMFDFLKSFDNHLKDVCKLSRLTDVMFPWLPSIYGNQDDMWIDVMILLLDIAPKGLKSIPITSTPPIIQHHVYFLQFVKAMTFDHLVLVDLLTSPETNILTYLTRYLKYCLHSWSALIECSKQLDETEREQVFSRKALEADSCELDKTNIIEKCNEKADVISGLGMIMDNYSDTNEEEVDNTEDINNEARGNKDDHDAARDDTFEKSQFPTDTSIVEGMFPKTSDNGNEIDNDVNALEDDLQNEGKCVSDQSKLGNVMKCINEDNVGQCHDAIDLSNDLNENMTHFKGDVKPDDCLFKCLDGTTTEKETEIADIDEDNTNGNANDENFSYSDTEIEHADNDDKNEKTDFDQGDTKGHGNYEDFSDSEIGSEQTEQDETDHNSVAFPDEDVIDKVMGMMIRTRLKMERLWRSGILQYNPEPLIRLLTALESRYEET